MKNIPKLNHKFYIRRGRRFQALFSLATGLLFTLGIPVFILLGVIYKQTGTQTAVNFLLTGLLILPTALVFVERLVVHVDNNAFFESVKRQNSTWLTYTVGWLLLGGYFSLAGIFAWGAGVYSVGLLQTFFELSISPNVLAIGFLLLSAIYYWGGGRMPRQQQQALLVFTGMGVLFLLVFWVSRAILPSNFSVVAFSSNANFALSTTAIMSLALWGVVVLFDRMNSRDQPRLLLNTAVTAIVISATLGFAAAYMLNFFSSTMTNSLAPWLQIGLQARLVVGVIFGLLMIGISLLGIRHTLLLGHHALNVMVATEFFPQKNIVTFKKITIHQFPLLLIGGFVCLLLLFFPIGNLLGLAVVSLFASILLVVAPDAFRSKPNLPEERSLKLPLHPLFPAVVSLACILTLSLIPLTALLGTIIWAVSGLVLYFVYVRGQQIVLRQHAVLLSNEEHELGDTDRVYTVLVPIVDEASALFTIQAAIQLAQIHAGRVLLLRILDSGNEDDSGGAKGPDAPQVLAEMNEFVAGLGDTAVPIIPLVRLDHEAVNGIYDTGWEEKIDFMLIGSEQFRADSKTVDIVERVLRRVPTEIGIIKGELPQTITKVLVPVQGSMHTAAALALGQELVRSSQGTVVALYLTADELTEEREQTSQQYIDKIVEKVGNSEFVESKIVQSNNFEKSILEEGEAVDLLLLGIATEGYFQQIVLDGRPVNIAVERTAPTMLIKQKETAIRHMFHRLITLLLDWIPSSTVKERAEITLQMQQDSQASTDFYILIVLSASIAFFGLVQNSVAVIIGAMLVAPLMSPMMALAHGLILANFKIMQDAANSTLRGILAAIGVATVLTIVLPPQPVTAEILARTQPNYLDLLVALVSGAAGAYAASRKNLSAALPGVAIAAALVPPLCVVGYGLVTGRIDIASGSLLLFLTNLASIVLASALVFLVMGYQPRRDDRYAQVRKNITRVVIALLIISVPLLFASVTSANDYETELTIDTIIRNTVDANSGEVISTVIQSQQGDGLVVVVTILAYEDFDAEAIYELQQTLTTAVDKPITLRVSAISATLTVVDGAGIPTPTPAPISPPTPVGTATMTPTITVQPRLSLTPTPP